MSDAAIEHSERIRGGGEWPKLGPNGKEREA